mmetsp:Transcript_5969/g.12890  ORF Transcript_5969/g.12890 Transcript_5969/m.12890 type:complete len:328 (+) Transcript_5969:342-1325(+)
MMSIISAQISATTASTAGILHVDPAKTSVWKRLAWSIRSSTTVPTAMTSGMTTTTTTTRPRRPLPSTNVAVMVLTGAMTWSAGAMTSATSSIAPTARSFATRTKTGFGPSSSATASAASATRQTESMPACCSSDFTALLRLSRRAVAEVSTSTASTSAMALVMVERGWHAARRIATQVESSKESWKITATNATTTTTRQPPSPKQPQQPQRPQRPSLTRRPQNRMKRPGHPTRRPGRPMRPPGHPTRRLGLTTPLLQSPTLFQGRTLLQTTTRLQMCHTTGRSRRQRPRSTTTTRSTRRSQRQSPSRQGTQITSASIPRRTFHGSGR